MTIRELRIKAAGELADIYDPKEGEQLTYILLEWVTGYNRAALALNQDLELGEAEELILTEKIGELKKGKPVQYITGQAWFYGLEFKVSEQVLIPRPETEELVQWVLKDHGNKKGLKVLDIGTGSGCIAVALGRFMDEPLVRALDVSPGALALAIRNALANNVEIQFILMDILDHTKWKDLELFDVIVSNPPYVRVSEQSGMQKNVLEYEPHAALFVPDEDALLYYRAIARFAKEKLTGGGTVYVEINENLGKEIHDLFRSTGFVDIELRRDMQGKDRMVRAVISK